MGYVSRKKNCLGKEKWGQEEKLWDVFGPTHWLSSSYGCIILFLSFYAISLGIQDLFYMQVKFGKYAYLRGDYVKIFLKSVHKNQTPHSNNV